LTLETHLSKYSYQGLSEYFLKYSGLQTLALLSLDSAHIYTRLTSILKPSFSHTHFNI